MRKGKMWGLYLLPTHPVVKLWIQGGQCLPLGFPGDTSGEEPACQWRRRKRCGFDPWLRKIPWRRAGNPLKYSCLENPVGSVARGLPSMGSRRVGHDWCRPSRMQEAAKGLKRNHLPALSYYRLSFSKLWWGSLAGSEVGASLRLLAPAKALAGTPPVGINTAFLGQPPLASRVIQGDGKGTAWSQAQRTPVPSKGLSDDTVRAPGRGPGVGPRALGGMEWQRQLKACRGSSCVSRDPCPESARPPSSASLDRRGVSPESCLPRDPRPLLVSRVGRRRWAEVPLEAPEQTSPLSGTFEQHFDTTRNTLPMKSSSALQNQRFWNNRDIFSEGEWSHSVMSNS